MHLLEITPAPCLVCGVGNATQRTATQDPPRFVDLERDVNWNDPAIMCEDCIARAAGMVGMASLDTLRELRLELEKRDQEIHDLQSEIDGMSRRASRLGMTFEKV
jgi:hypothetical protein